VEIKEGPYQIQRDDTRRRIIVAFNVRNRDVESIVTELQQKIDESVVFAPGYTVTYGGQFENLVEARERLAFAVPLALLLIFVLLYFTFGSIKQGILIFTAIPLSAIGGIFALWLRDMPFSISAGVGFIALFGVAVLNGIVLISEFNHLKKEGISDIFERIYKGTSVRLRPVIMTAAVASLGFLPMALSQSGGAEVQRPLATVVIGGLITATFLTLVVLPILYYYFERGLKIKPGAAASIIVFGLLFFQMPHVQAQETVNTYQSLEEAIQTAIDNNPGLRAADLRTQQEKALKGASWNLPKTSVSLTHGQYNSVYKNDNQFNIDQSFAFPTVYANQNQLAKARVEASEWMRTATQNELVQQVKATWYTLWLEMSKQDLLLEQDSIYQRFVRAANLRYETGESNLLEKATAESQVAEIKVMLQQSLSDIEIYQTQLQTLLNLDNPVDITVGKLEARESSALLDPQGISNNPTLAWFRQQMEVAEREKSVERSRLLPDLTVGYFNQSLNGPAQDLDGNPITFTSGDRFTGFQVGIAIPIFGAKSQASAIKAAEFKKQESEARLQAVTNELQGRLSSLIQQFQKFQISLDYYEQNALPQAELILKQAQKGFENGEIGYVEYIQGLNRALTVRFNYLDILNQYNQTIIQIEFISGVQ
jgi:cobalt-zinc-cadmium resistance protein CzcA